MQQLIYWGAYVRWTSDKYETTYLRRKGVLANSFIAELCEQDSRASQLQLSAFNTRWQLIAPLLSDARDDVFWIQLTSMQQLSLRKLNALASKNGQAAWLHLTQEDRYRRWIEILSSCTSANNVIAMCKGATQTAWSCYCYCCCCCCACSCFARARWLLLLLQSLLLHQPRPRRYRWRQTVSARLSQNPRQARPRRMMRRLAKPVRAQRRRRSRVQTRTRVAAAKVRWHRSCQPLRTIMRR